ncbi:MAG: UpxY family transcription antiterminator [Bacteroidales bacterium]
MMLNKECISAQKSEVLWYVMRLAYSNELKFKNYLDSLSIESFIPMHYEFKVVKRVKQRILVPVIHNLIFVHTSKNILDAVKCSTDLPVRYYTQKINNKHYPIIVPDIQMQNFIAIAGSYDEDLKYLSEEAISLVKGDRVRIIEGIFAGVEGVFVKLKGTRARRVVVEIAGIAAVATTSIHPSMVEKI